MPQTIKDAGGNDISVFTEAEVKEQETAALAKYQAEHPDQSAALSTAQEEAKAAKDALAAATAAGGDDKDKNFGALRASVKAAEDKAEKIRVDSLAAIEAMKNAPTVEFQTELLDRASGTDKTLREKIDLNYKALSGMPSSNKAEVKLRMEAAYKLSVDKPVPGMFDGGAGRMGDRGNGGMPQAGDQNKETDNAKLIRGQLGITDEAAAKFAPKPGQPGYQG